jgi:hypothetical protein
LVFHHVSSPARFNQVHSAALESTLLPANVLRVALCLTIPLASIPFEVKWNVLGMVFFEREAYRILGVLVVPPLGQVFRPGGDLYMKRHFRDSASRRDNDRHRFILFCVLIAKPGGSVGYSID